MGESLELYPYVGKIGDERDHLMNHQIAIERGSIFVIIK